MVIHLPTTEEREDILRRRYRVRRPEHRRAMYIGGGGVSIPGDAAAIAAVSFNGNFASLFSGAYQVVQTDLGLTYGATPLATAGNTSTTVLTLTGTITGAYVPILVKATNTLAIGVGAQFSVSFNGGSTFAMTGVTPTAGAPVALTGAGAGLSIAWSSGASITNDTWKATAAGLADQQVGMPINDYSQATATKQPIVTVGVNGKAGLVGDGVSSSLVSLLNRPAPGTTPHTTLLVGRILTWVSNTSFIGSTSTQFAPGGVLLSPSTPSIKQACGAFGNANAGMVLGSFAAMTSFYSNSISDSLKCGAAAVSTGVSCGTGAGTGCEIFSAGGVSFSNFELLALIYAPGNVSDIAFRAAVNSAAGYGVGNVLV